MNPGDLWGGHERALRRFGAALARDDKVARDDRAAAALVEPLIRQTILEFRNSADFPLDADEQRERVLACFIQRYRRHVRLICANDEEGEWSLSAPGSPPGNVRTAIHRLPLELRESLLLVVLEGFSHARAAATLEIGLAQLMDRLCAARRALSGALPAAQDAVNALRWRKTPHLRLIK